MQVKTEAIVLHTLRYGDTDLIVKLFTATNGISSYLIRGVLKSKKGKLRTSYFQPLSILEIDALHKSSSSLHRLLEVKPVIHFSELHSNIVKGSIVVFLIEILNQIIPENQSDIDLYQFIKSSFLWLDKNKEIQSFHIVFLLQLTAYLGFYPNVSNQSLPQFDLSEGCFTTGSKSKYIITHRILEAFNSVLGIEFDELNEITLAKSERIQLLNSILVYFELHIEGFRRPKSLNIFQELFN